MVYSEPRRLSPLDSLCHGEGCQAVAPVLRTQAGKDARRGHGETRIDENEPFPSWGWERCDALTPSLYQRGAAVQEERHIGSKRLRHSEIVCAGEGEIPQA